MFEKNLRLILLFDIYGELFTDTQRNVFDLYYNDDLSLAEVAENVGITRQGVRDSIKRTEEALLQLEEKLGFAEKISRASEAAEKVASGLTSLKEKYPKDAPLLDEMAEALKAALL